MSMRAFMMLFLESFPHLLFPLQLLVRFLHCCNHRVFNYGFRSRLTEVLDINVHRFVRVGVPFAIDVLLYFLMCGKLLDTSQRMECQHPRRCAI